MARARRRHARERLARRPLSSGRSSRGNTRRIAGVPARLSRRGTMETMQRSGYADLPLHGGTVPAWLAERMTRLGTAIVESVVLHYRASAFLSRLIDTLWFH